MPIEISYTYDIMVAVLFDNSKLFRDIAQLKSVSRAASHHGMSQSAASQHIQELEKKLGIALFDRGTRPLTLTAAGKLYLELCRDVLRREEEFTAELDDLKARVEGEVRVASIYSIGLSEMSRLREEFAFEPDVGHLLDPVRLDGPGFLLSDTPAGVSSA